MHRVQYLVYSMSDNNVSHVYSLNSSLRTCDYQCLRKGGAPTKSSLSYRHMHNYLYINMYIHEYIHTLAIYMYLFMQSLILR